MLSAMFYISFVLYICASIVLVLVVLVQSGKGGGLSGLVGAGSTLGDHLGATGAEKTLNRWTSYCAVGFLVLNILLVLVGNRVYRSSLLESLPSSSPAKTAPGALPSVTPGATEQVPQPVAPAAAQNSPAAPAKPAPAK